MAGGASLDPADVQRARGELDLIPTQIDKLRSPEAMPVGHKDHGGIAMPPTVLPGSGHQPFDLGLGQVLAGAQVGVGKPLWCDCSFYGGWSDQLEVRLCHVFGPPTLNDCSDNALSSDSVQYKRGAFFNCGGSSEQYPDAKSNCENEQRLDDPCASPFTATA